MMKARTLLRSIVALLLFMVLMTTLYVCNLYIEVAVKHILPTGQSRHLLVKKGVKVRQFAAMLKQQGLIQSPLYFTVAYVSQHPSKTLQAGLYAIDDSHTVLDLVEMVAKGQSILESLTLIEGWTWHQVQQSLQQERRFDVHTDAHIMAQLNKQFPRTIWGRPVQHMEGLLMPDTFKFKRGISDMVIITDAFAKQAAFMTDAWRARDRSAGYRSPYQALIVASLIEKESCYPPEYPKIAAVILNRLHKKIPIQIDASILYGLQRHQQRVRFSDLKIDTPYNTYKHKGLPPTPISMPSKQAILAALHPYKFDALFYVLDASKKNAHIFTNTFESHLKAKYNYQAAQKR